MLPVVEIHDISAGVMERVLDFVYTDSFPAGLGAEWLTPAGAEQLFNAADMLLLFSMKVRWQHLCGFAGKGSLEGVGVWRCASFVMPAASPL